MARWTSTLEEYAHLRRICTEFSLCDKVTVNMKDGTTFVGIVTGSHPRVNADENPAAGEEPIVTSASCEIEVQLAQGETFTLDALDISDIVKN